MVLAALSQFTIPYEETPEGFIRGFSRDARYEYEARLSESAGAPEVAEVTVIRTGDSWTRPIAQIFADTWKVAPRESTVHKFVEDVKRAILTDASYAGVNR